MAAADAQAALRALADEIAALQKKILEQVQNVTKIQVEGARARHLSLHVN